MRMYSGQELVRELSQAFGPSGCEDGVRAFIRAQIGASCDGMTEDRAGNLIVRIAGRGMDYDPAQERRLMVSAHMDEVGFMVREITDEGYLKFSLIGQIDPRVLCGRHVVVGEENRTVKGVIATKAIHMQTAEERTKATPVNKMYIDIGAKSATDAEKLVQVGDYATFDSDLVPFGKDGRYIKGKALGGRLACAALIEIIRYLHASTCELAYDVYFAFTCNREIGISGASVAAFTVNPTLAILTGATAVNDLPGVSPEARVAALGEGCVLSLADRQTLYDAGLTRFAARCAEEGGTRYQIKQGDSDTSDGAPLQRFMAGVRTVSLSVPVRYTHSAACVASYEDYQALLNLCKAVICGLKP